MISYFEINKFTNHVILVSEIDYSGIYYSGIYYSRDWIRSTMICSPNIIFLFILLPMYFRFLNTASYRLIKQDYQKTQKAVKGAIGPDWWRNFGYFLNGILQDDYSLRGPLHASLETDREIGWVLVLNINWRPRDPQLHPRHNAHPVAGSNGNLDSNSPRIRT